VRDAIRDNSRRAVNSVVAGEGYNPFLHAKHLLTFVCLVPPRSFPRTETSLNMFAKSGSHEASLSPREPNAFCTVLSRHLSHSHNELSPWDYIEWPPSCVPIEDLAVVMCVHVPENVGRLLLNLELCHEIRPEKDDAMKVRHSWRRGQVLRCVLVEPIMFKLHQTWCSSRSLHLPPTKIET
jgi:hypothetical protein